MAKRKKLTRKEFLKYAAFGGGGFAMAAHPAGKSLFARNPDNPALWKWSKEAEFYIETPRGLKCQLCPNECDVEEDEPGDCRTRVYHKGKLYTIAYGNPATIHVDPIEKKPLLHFYPESRALSIATAGCNLACLNCQNWQLSQSNPRDTRNFDLMPDKVIERAKDKNCKSIAYTYSDPIAFYEYTLDTAKLARKAGIKNVIVSAGYINEDPLRFWTPHLDGANIDLKSFSDEVYARLNAGKLDPVLRTLKILKEEGVWLEITNLIVPEWTDDMDLIRKMVKWLYKNGFEDAPLHFSRFTPMYKLKKLPPTPVATLEKARQIALDAGMKYAYIGNVPGHEGENTYCPGCGEMLLERRGYYILQNHIQNGTCKYCGTKIAGRWD